MMLLNFIVLAWGVINLIAALYYPEPEPEPEPMPEYPEPPAPIIPEPVTIPEPEPPPEPPKIKPYTPPEPDPDREQLEKTAAGMLVLSGCKFNTFYYCHELTDRELMDIIKDFNLNN